MKLRRTAFAFVICLFVHVEGQSQSCSAECSQLCGNEGLIFPGSNGTIVNVAFGKRASVSSLYSDSSGPSAPACIAVNGRTSTTYRTTTEANTNCIHTGLGDHNASWSVDLGRNYTVTNITIYRRKDTPQRMSGIHVEVDSQTCYTFPLADDNITALDNLPEKIDVTCTPPLTGRVVRLQKRDAFTNTYYGVFLINVCEVQVWGCKDGLHGAECVEQCGQCADSDTCSAVSGHCPHGCEPGWQGDNCKQVCDAGKYGDNCSSGCGHCNTGDVCHHINGTCLLGCEAGYDPSDPLCERTCQNGGYGDNCSEPCGQCNGGDQCDSFTGTCVSCQPEFKPPLCKVCMGKRYGASCELNCSTKCGGDGSCEKNTGRCVGKCIAGYRSGESGFCNDVCEDGKYGKECSQECGNCKGACRHEDGFCAAGCVDGFGGDLCTNEVSNPGSDNVPLIGGVAGGVVVLIALCALLTIIIIRRRKNKPEAVSAFARSSSEPVNGTRETAPSFHPVSGFESGAPAELSGHAVLQEETGAEESHVYDGLQTPDDSDRATYTCLVLQEKQDTARNCHTYQNPAFHTSDTAHDYYNL